MTEQIDWKELERLEMEDRIAANLRERGCTIATEKTDGKYFCSRFSGHDGPCAAHEIEKVGEVIRAMAKKASRQLWAMDNLIT